MGGAALMLAHQVAGKAVRDSLFLTNYPVSELPKMVMASAALAVVFVLLFARAMGRFGPLRLVPAGFFLSAVAHAAEYSFLADAPALWSVLVYLHIVGLGAILLSGFWSQMAESFDPRAAKQVFGRIAGAGTLGGIAGGLMAERVAALFTASSVLLLLAALHLLCAIVLATVRGGSPGSLSQEPAEPISPRELFRRAPYLRMIAVVVLAGTSSAAVLDYLFKAGAGAAFEKGAPLLRFFAIFYTATQVLTFLAQTLLARRLLNKLGIGRTVSALPLGVGAGALGALLIPAFPVFAALRSLEFVLRGSLFRSGYELLYTPIPAGEKRAAKTLIDVACDRAGDALGSGVVQLLLLFGGSFVTSGSLGAALALAAIGVWAALRLDAAYSALVEQRLVDRAVELDLADIQDSTTRSAILSSRASHRAVDAARPPQSRPVLPASSADPTLDAIRELRSGDSRRVLAALQNIERPRPVVAAQIIRLLAWDEVSDAVRELLLRDPRHITGLLIDHLTGQDAVQFGIRRRIPRILARCDSLLAVHGLLAGLNDVRFEVRFQCSRALDSLVQAKPGLAVPADAVFGAVDRELHIARPIWNSRHLLDRRDGSDPNAFLDEILRERADASLEHIFSLFATVLPREPVKIAFRALHTDDKLLRGLAVEYLDGVLPPGLRERLWAVVEPNSEIPPAGPDHDALADLLRCHQSLLLIIDGTRPGG